MCIIIDTNSLANVFNADDENHFKFKPIHDWLHYGGGKVLIGGTRYRRELSRAPKFLKAFAELSRRNKTIYFDDAKVDLRERFVSKIIKHKDFDDQHLVGLLLESGCKLICSLDKRAYKYFTNTNFFSRASKPKIYSRKSHYKLLQDNRNIVDICKPCTTYSKGQTQLSNKKQNKTK